MRPDTRLDSAAFQLTPTRTRCDLVVTANGRKEKIASGLLNPFVAHLKAAQEQIAKGGYTILLEAAGDDAPWFTRGTLERFVRFVSTPEVLERVTTVEAEMLQLEDAIAVQTNENLALRSAEGHNGKPADNGVEGSKTSYDPDGDQALVLYKPDMHPAPPPKNDDGGAHEENSKVQLLRVLETRKSVLRKEQAMAFARAVAAGFDIDNLLYLISFAERFGASRLMKACTQFIDLWRQKHETGQWIDVEPEAMSVRSEFPPYNAAGIMFTGDKEAMSVSNGDANGEDAARADYRPPQHPHGPYQSAYPPWAMHPPYPQMQGMPYYPPYYPPPPYPPPSEYNHSERRPSRKHSSDNSKDFDNSDDDDQSGDQSSGSERETSHHGRGKSSKKGSKRSSKKKPNVIVIRNVNVRSKKHGSSESESHTSEDSDDDSSKRNHHKRSSSKKKGGKKIIAESEDEVSRGQDGDQGNWNAFQNFLLRDEEKTRDINDADLFANEKGPPPPPRRKESRTMDDPILLSERGSADVDERNAVSFSSANGRIRTRAGDDLMMSGEGRQSYADGDVIKEIEAGGGGYRRGGGGGDDFMVYGQDNSMDRGSSLDPLAEAHYRRPAPAPEAKNNVHDESFMMIPVRSSSPDNLGAESRTAIDIDADFPTTVQKASDAKSGVQLFYEPDELLPEREVEDVSFGYDPSMDYDSHMQVQHDTTVENAEVEDSSLCVVEDEEKVPAGKDKKLRSSLEGKRRMDASARRLSSSSKGPLTDAQKRAQNLRAYKADLQKEKKEQEAEQIKRLERLKQERQKRIAARSGASNPVSTPPQAKAKPSPKISPSTHKSSKFTDAEPQGSSSPLRKLPARSTPGTGSDPHQKTAKASKLGDNDSTNAVSKSTSSSLAEMKKEKSGKTESLSSLERPKKLAEPKSSAPTTDHPPTSSKSASADHQPRRRSLPEDVQTKKISAIMQLDQSKSAALPELKVKSPRAPAAAAAAAVKNKAAAKETKEGPRGYAKAHPASVENGAGKKANGGKVSRASDSDDNVVVVEKSVVMLENEEVVSAPPPVVLPPGRRIAENLETSNGDRLVNPSLESEYTAIRAPPSAVVLPGDVNNLAVHTSENQLNSYEVDVPEYHKDDELDKPTLASVEKPPYEAPFARVTSLEDAAPAYHHPLPAHEARVLEPVYAEPGVRARVPEPVYAGGSDEEAHEENEKPRSKEAKGFRKLLKFGKKSHASAMDSDASSVDEVPAGDGSMLKTLISQDDSAVGSSSKASRSFSLLSPFRKNKVIVL